MREFIGARLQLQALDRVIRHHILNDHGDPARGM